jgi:hypothetical protein
VNLRPTTTLPLALATLALCGCLGNSGSPTAPPANVQTYAGDAMFSITWDDDPLVVYWLFYAQNPTVTPFDLDNNNNPLLNFGYLVPVTSPAIVCNNILHTIINLSVSGDAGFPPYYVTINGRTGTAPGGTGSAPVAAVPRPAASTGAPWVAGSPIPATIRGLGYIPLTSCGYSGVPPQGIFFAVGPAGAIYSSTLAQTVAGPLTNPGNAPMTWLPGNLPIGFQGNFNAVAGRAGSFNNPGNPNLLVVAVGDDGVIVRSIDGINWQQSNAVPPIEGLQVGNLHDIAFTGANFIAVGDNGVVITSSDGMNWIQSVAAAAANPNRNALRAIRCAGGTCMAVGDNGTTVQTTTGGAAWNLLQFGTNNWTHIAYGNTNANSDAVYVNGGFALSNQPINTWVVADNSGDYGYFAPFTGGNWVAGSSIIAPGIVAVDYSTNFVALDSGGNAWISERGTTGSWATYSSAQLYASGGTAVGLRSTGQGFVAVGTTGANAASF